MKEEYPIKDPSVISCDRPECNNEFCFVKHDIGFGHTYRHFCSKECEKKFLKK